MTEENKDNETPDTAEKKDVASRGWMLTIPAEGHDDPEKLKQTLAQICSAFIFQLEEGSITGYKHYQCFLQFDNPRHWSTVKKRLQEHGLDDAHVERQWATAAACYRYCSKKETQLAGPWVVGAIQMRDRQGERSDITALKKKVLDEGLTYEQILLEDETGNAARYRLMIRDLEEVRRKKQLNQQAWRQVDVNYLYGPTGVGKTRLMFDRYKPDELYRITDYRNPWDLYDGQHVVVFDEFAGQVDIESMLVWLDGYTVQLPARYRNRVSRYDTVWVLSNLSLGEHYSFKPEQQRAAFRRRFSHVYMMDKPGVLTEELHAETVEEAISKLGL